MGVGTPPPSSAPLPQLLTPHRGSQAPAAVLHSAQPPCHGCRCSTLSPRAHLTPYTSRLILCTFFTPGAPLSCRGQAPHPLPRFDAHSAAAGFPASSRPPTPPPRPPPRPPLGGCCPPHHWSSLPSPPPPPCPPHLVSRRDIGGSGHRCLHRLCSAAILFILYTLYFLGCALRHFSLYFILSRLCSAAILARL